MSMANPIITITDLATFTLNKADLTDMVNGQVLSTPRRGIPFVGFEWWINYCPAGLTAACKGFVSVFLRVDKPVKAKYTFDVGGTSFRRSCVFEFTDSKKDWGFSTFALHSTLRPLFKDGKLTITCNIEFTVSAPFPPSIPRNYQLFNHLPTDVELVVGSDRVPAHKNFLSMISPVFHATFSHDTVESKSGESKICDFDFDTVKAAIDFCYGRELNNLYTETAVDILRFCDKYFITTVINELEKLPWLIPTVQTFWPIVHYAYYCNRNELLTDCYQFFKEHHYEIKELKMFCDLPPALVIDVLKSAFELKTDFDVLRRAHEDKIEFVMNHLEQPLLESMTLDDFCPAVSYAWDCSRDDLKKICAQYLNDNRDEVLDLKAFDELPSETAHKVLKASYDVKHDNRNATSSSVVD